MNRTTANLGLPKWTQLVLVVILIGAATTNDTVNAFSPISKFERFTTRIHSSSASSSSSSSSVSATLTEPQQSTTTATTKTTISDTNSNDQKKKKTNRVSILLCPAQFCVPADYNDFFQTIQDHYQTSDDETTTTTTTTTTIGTCRVAPLPRTEWIKVAKQLPTKSFFTANLDCSTTLNWYFNAIEDALADIYAQEGQDANICLIGHSIGGWVARAYLGGLSLSSTATYRNSVQQEQQEGQQVNDNGNSNGGGGGRRRGGITSFITLGSPHSSPDTALVDQTRGLLRQVTQTTSCSSKALVQDLGIKVTCVGSTAIPGNILSTNIEELVAATSYLPLISNAPSVITDTIVGDGIIPQELAFMENPALRIEVEKCNVTGEDVRHAHVLPTPWNLLDGSAPSIALPKEFRWYGSKGVMEQWIDNIV